jgi:tetratricopeptide (TPR) repeat protein
MDIIGGFMTDLYEELYLSESSDLEGIQRILAKQRRDWTARSDAMPEEASRMLVLIDEADAAFATEESRTCYDVALAASRQPVIDPDRDALRQADYERFCAVAAEYFDTNEFDLAEVAIGNALKNAPAGGADLALCKLATKTYFALGKFDPALTYVNQAIVLAPSDPGLYLYKFRVATELGRTARDDRRGSRDALMNTLRITVGKAESAADDGTLAVALDELAWLVFAQRGAESDDEARGLAARAITIDPSLSQASQVLATLRVEEQRRLQERAAEEQRRLARERAAEVQRLLQAAEDIVNAGGGPKWVCLDVDPDHSRVLLITRDIVASRAYNDKSKPITWEECTLRRLLNTDFLGSLPVHIKSRAVAVTNQNPNNLVHKTLGGSPTRDRVFLLSIDEAAKFFKSGAGRVSRFNGSVGWWWLRSPGIDQLSAANVGDDGIVNVGGADVGRGRGGVRPALWLHLDV